MTSDRSGIAQGFFRVRQELIERNLEKAAEYEQRYIETKVQYFSDMADKCFNVAMTAEKQINDVASGEVDL